MTFSSPFSWKSPIKLVKKWDITVRKIFSLGKKRKRKEKSSVYSTVTTTSVWSWLTSADCRGDSGQRQTDGRRDTRVMAGRWSSVSNPRQYHGCEYFSILFRRWANVHPIRGNTTQYRTPRSDSDSKVMVERWSTDCNSSIRPGMRHLWTHNSFKQILSYTFKQILQNL